jgi:hemolysin activation/secretion protein
LTVIGCCETVFVLRKGSAVVFVATTKPIGLVHSAVVGCFLIAGMAPAQPQVPPALSTPQRPNIGDFPSPPVPSQQIIRDLAPVERPTLAPGLQGAPIRQQQGLSTQANLNISSVTVTGNTAVPNDALAQLVAGLAWRAASQVDIEEARVAVLTEYRNRGYPFVSVTAVNRAEDNAVTVEFAVQEGRVAQVRLDRDIGPAGVQVLRFLNGAMAGEIATTSRLERALLLANDVPGVTVRAVLRPMEGGAAGDLELVAEVTRRPFSGLITGDNRGYRLSGPVQFLAIGQANSFTSFGERTEVTFFTSSQAEALFGQVSNEFFIGGSGLRVRLYAGAGRNNPSGTLSAIGYAGLTRTVGAAVSYPLIRSRSVNLVAGSQFDLYDSTIDTGTSQVARQSRDYIRAIRFGLDGQYLDSFLPLAGAATNNGNFRIHQGIAALGASRSGTSPGPARTGSEFGFTKLTGEAQRTQPIYAIRPDMLFSLQGTVAGQWTNNVLPSAEKFFLGGNRLGRGFYSGQVSGDRAVVMSLEAQLDVGLPSVNVSSLGPLSGQLRPSAQFYAFYDAGRTYENLRTDPNRRLESFGLGVRTNFNDTVSIDLEGVRRITRQVDAGGASVRPLPADAGYVRVLTRF